MALVLDETVGLLRALANPQETLKIAESLQRQLVAVTEEKNEALKLREEAAALRKGVEATNAKIQTQAEDLAKREATLLAEKQALSEATSAHEARVIEFEKKLADFEARNVELRRAEREFAERNALFLESEKEVTSLKLDLQRRLNLMKEAQK